MEYGEFVFTKTVFVNWKLIYSLSFSLCEITDSKIIHFCTRKKNITHYVFSCKEISN